MSKPIGHNSHVPQSPISHSESKGTEQAQKITLQSTKVKTADAAAPTFKSYEDVRSQLGEAEEKVHNQLKFNHGLSDRNKVNSALRQFNEDFNDILENVSGESAVGLMEAKAKLLIEVVSLLSQGKVNEVVSLLKIASFEMERARSTAKAVEWLR